METTLTTAQLAKSIKAAKQMAARIEKAFKACGIESAEISDNFGEAGKGPLCQFPKVYYTFADEYTAARARHVVQALGGDNYGPSSHFHCYGGTGIIVDSYVSLGGMHMVSITHVNE
jgi:hypothetical protein